MLTDKEKRILETQDTHRVPLTLDGEKVTAVGKPVEPNPDQKRDR